MATKTSTAVDAELAFARDAKRIGQWTAFRNRAQRERQRASHVEDAEAGQLPAVSIVDPDLQAGSEENPQDVQTGEGFAADGRSQSSPRGRCWCGQRDHTPAFVTRRTPDGIVRVQAVTTFLNDPRHLMSAIGRKRTQP